ncbi:MAG: FKBP-type peptidyl-prolyl cis-trans isomerase [Archangium sp.]|nr:FKBP-type peptidyl-prolyl cis-trans isomerase [Archangium sp.]
MKTSIRITLLGAALVLSACPSDNKPDAGAAPVAVNPALNPANPGINPLPTPPPPPPLTAEDKQKALYAFGALIAERTPVKAAEFSEADLAEVVKGMKDAAAGKELSVKMEDFGPKVEQLLNEKQAAKAEAEKKKGVEFLAKSAKEKGAKKTASGLVYIDTTPGTGKSPVATDTVSVHYKGTLIDGTEFDSSYKRGQPTEFPLNGVIKCWTEGVAMMKVGGKAKLVCPSDIAYGDRGAGANIPGGATLVFEVELLAIKDPAQMAPPPIPNLGVPTGATDKAINPPPPQPKQ